jgi:hypothetical protein
MNQKKLETGPSSAGRRDNFILLADTCNISRVNTKPNVPEQREELRLLFTHA